MCEKYCGKLSWWLTDEFRGMKTSEIPHSNDFPCSNPKCEIRFKMAWGIPGWIHREWFYPPDLPGD